jgi:hypothetical protein
LNFDFSDKFPKKGKVTVTTETSSTTTILFRGKTTHPAVGYSNGSMDQSNDSKDQYEDPVTPPSQNSTRSSY